jgi:hypothetical protein
MNIPSNPAQRKFGYTMDGDRVPLDKNGKSRISHDRDGDKVYSTWSGHKIEKVYNYDGDVVELRAKGDPSDVIW